MIRSRPSRRTLLLAVPLLLGGAAVGWLLLDLEADDGDAARPWENAALASTSGASRLQPVAGAPPRATPERAAVARDQATGPRSSREGTADPDRAFRGVVRDPAGVPLGDAQVRLLPVHEDGTADGTYARLARALDPPPVPSAETRTDRWGQFAFSTPRLDVLRLDVRCAGFAPFVSRPLILHSREVEQQISIVLQPAARLHGRVRRVDGQGVAGVRVVAVGLEDRSGGAATVVEASETLTDGRGDYVLDTLAVGVRYRLGVEDPPRPIVVERAWIDLTAAGAERDLVLPPACALEGIVRSRADGRSVRGAQVDLVVGRPASLRSASPGGGWASVLRVVADAQGAFRIDGLAPGPIAYCVSAPGFVTASAAPGTATSWGAVRAGETLQVEIELERGAVIEGTVRRSEGGRAVAGARIAAYPQAPPAAPAPLRGCPEARSDADGRYRIEGVPPGRHAVVARTAALASRTRTSDAVLVTVHPGETARADLDLLPTARVSGRLIDERGQPVPGCVVRAEPVFNAAAGRAATGLLTGALAPACDALTGLDGRYEIAGLVAGTDWRITATGDGYAPAVEARVPLGAGTAQHVDFTLVRAQGVQGRVLDAAGRPVVGARLRIRHRARAATGEAGAGGSLDTVHSQQSDERGRFRLWGLAPGSVAIDVTHPDHVALTGPRVSMGEAGRAEDYVISMARARHVVGHVAGADGKPVHGATVVAIAAVEGQLPEIDERTLGTCLTRGWSAKTDERGRFRIGGLPDVSVSVAVWGAYGYRTWHPDRAPDALLRVVLPGTKAVRFELEPTR